MPHLAENLCCASAFGPGVAGEKRQAIRLNHITIMKTTLNIDDTIMAELKREAARQGRTMSELVETALRLLLRSHRKREKLVALPTFHSGGTLVDIADRNALYQAMEGR